MKIALMICIVGGFGYLGWGFSRYYAKRLWFFTDCVLLCERLCVDISFSKDRLKTIIQNALPSFHKDMKNALAVYQKYLDGESIDLQDELAHVMANLVSEDEKNTFFLFMKNLGRLDVLNQTKEIENFKTKFELNRKQAETENKKLGGLYMKLGIILGLLIAILLI